MTGIAIIEGRAAPLPGININTDLVLPARFLKKPRGSGYQDYLFHDLRFDDHGNRLDGFVLNDPRYEQARILVAGPNFGCGSSREGAVYALVDYGIGCVIAESFGDIFAANSAKNGLLAIRMPADRIQSLWTYIDRTEGASMRVDLPNQTLTAGDTTLHFDIEAYLKQMLLSGQDDIDFTGRYMADIQAYEERMASAG